MGSKVELHHMLQTRSRKQSGVPETVSRLGFGQKIGGLSGDDAAIMSPSGDSSGSSLNYV